MTPRPACRTVLHALLLTLSLGGTAALAGGLDDDLLEAYQLHRNGQTEEAMRIWRPLAAQGQVDAQYNLGVVHQHADGVRRDYAAALRWYALAAAQGDVEAQRAIGTMHMRGQGVKRDVAKGMRWMMLATAIAHHEHLTVAHRWQGQLERAIQQDEQKRLELLYVKSQEDGDRVLADLQRRAGLVEEDAAQVARAR
jgi:TPR repeat protein